MSVALALVSPLPDAPPRHPAGATVTGPAGFCCHNCLKRQMTTVVQIDGTMAPLCNLCAAGVYQILAGRELLEAACL